MWKRILLIVVVILALAAALLASKWRKEPLHVSGFIEAHEIRVGSRVGGRIARIPAIEGAAVNKGDILLELEPYDLTARLTEAKAQLAAKQADLDRLQRGFRTEEIAQATAKREQLAAHRDLLVHGPRKQDISTAEARLTLAQAQLKLAQSNFDRTKSAFDTSSASRDDMDRASDSLSVSQANLSVRQQELDALKEGSRKEDISQAEAQLAEAEQALALMTAGYRKEDIAAAQAAANAADAAVKTISTQIEELIVRAPADGIVEAVELRPGDMVNPGAPALTLLDPSELWVRAYLPENHLDVTDGQTVRVTVDSLPSQSFTGHLTFISRQAEFTPGNVQTPEERSKQVFRIKVTLDPATKDLRAGMAADVWLK
jgi:HlyD family secretion protein